MTTRDHFTSSAFRWCALVALAAVFALLGSPALVRAARAEAPPPLRVAKVEDPQVTIDNFAFSPPTLTVFVGSTVTWTNQDDMVHTVTEANRLFSSKSLETGDVYAHTFTAPGTYTYFCALHPRMTATIIVK
jgi:plastocyanin